MPARTARAEPTNPLQSVSQILPKIFDQIQTSVANHQKNLVALHKLHASAAAFTESVQNGKSIKLTGERIFEDEFLSMLARVLVVKKGVTQADRVVKFIGGYVKFINDKAIASASGKDEGEYDDPDTTASRFIARTLKFLLRGFTAKDKTVRYRVVQLVAELVSHLGEIDEEVYTTLRSSLLARVYDKEPYIRVQAVIGLSKLCGSEDPSDLGHGERTAIDVLVEIMTTDPSADVRRAALLNIPLAPETLPAVLARTRDIDAGIRKTVFSSVLESNIAITVSAGEDTATSIMMGPTHPRALSIAQRELIVRNGLGDREAAVRGAASIVMGEWADATKNAKKENDGVDTVQGQENDKKEKIAETLVAFLKLFDLVEGKVAEDALKSVFEVRAVWLDELEFGETFWDNLTPERAFLARVFVDYCITTKDENRLENALPVVTAFAFRVQNAYNALLGDESAAEDDEERRQEEREEKEFMIGEMLRLAVDLDYADEIGRRKMFGLVREMISQEALPEALLPKCLDVLRVLSPNERDLIRVVVEVVHELRDGDSAEAEIEEELEVNEGETETTFGETPSTRKVAPRGGVFHNRARDPEDQEEDISPEERARADAMDLRCLSLCIGMLERVNGTFEENSTLEGILGELIVPSVKRKEMALREKGLISLGLCCLIAKRMANSSFHLLMHQIQIAPEALKISVLQIVFDILMVHEGEFLGKTPAMTEQIIGFLLSVLEQDESDKVSAIVCIGFAKLTLSGMITDERVLKSLVLSYLSPDTSENQELRQCLSYFFPVYCYSSPVNQRRMQEIFISIYERIEQAYRELEDEQDMVSPAQVASMFVDWTDPQKVIVIEGRAGDDSIHIDLASNIVKKLFNQDLSKESKKGLCQALSKLYIPDNIDDDKIRTLKLLMHNLQYRRPLRDSTANNAFSRFDTAISKKFEKQLEGFSEEEYRQLEQLKALFEFLDGIIPEDDDEFEDSKKRTGKKRRSISVASTASTEDTTITTSSKRGSKSKAKRRRLSTSDNEDDETEVEDGPPPAPTRTMPKRAAASRKPIPVQNISDDEDEAQALNAQGKPAASSNRKPPKRRGQSWAEEAQLDAEIDGLLDGDTREDSIFDGEEDDDEDEVNSLLEGDD